MPKTIPDLPGIPPSDLPFSKVVEANGFVFIAGQVGDAPDAPGKRVPGEIRDEVRAMLANVERLLTAWAHHAGRREVHGLPDGHERFRGDERGLSDGVHRGPPGPRDRRRRPTRQRFSVRDRGPGSPLRTTARGGLASAARG